MSTHLDLLDYERSLISDGLQIMMIHNAKNSLEVKKEEARQCHENLSLELFALYSKIKLFDLSRYVQLSRHELKLMNSGLLFLADFTYQKSLEKTEKHKAKYYEKCNLQFIKIREKINRVESYNIH